MLKTVRTPLLEIAYEETGAGAGAPVILLHGFPDDPHAYDGVAPLLADAGHRVLRPWLRGYGGTRFLDASTPRSGQQAALGADLLAFLDALDIRQAKLVGYDWGGRAACIVSALWPERVSSLVTCGGYNLQDLAAAARPAPAETEYRMWYQWYFHTERGRAGLAQNSRDIARLLWQLWSPNYRFDDATLNLTAASFANPDFADVVAHSYRHRHNAAPGDPALEPIETLLAERPPITVQTINLMGDSGILGGSDTPDRHAQHFKGPYERRTLPGVGHFIPRETPEAIVQAALDLA